MDVQNNNDIKCNNNDSSANTNISNQESSSSLNPKNLSNTNNLNTSSASSLARSLLSNNFTFSNSLQNNLDSINGYNIRFGNLNINNNENQSKNDETVSSTIISNGLPKNENAFVNSNSIYNNAFNSTSTSNSSSSFASYLTFNQMQPKSKVNIINSSFNNIFNNIRFNDLEKSNILKNEKLKVENLQNNEELNISNNNEFQDSSSKLMFGTLNITKPYITQNTKGKEISSSNSGTNNDNNELNETIEKRKLNIVSTIDHSVIGSIGNNNNLISDEDVERIVGSYRQIINNVIQRENMIHNNINEIQNLVINLSNNSKGNRNINENNINDVDEDNEARLIFEDNENINNNNNETNNKSSLNIENNFFETSLLKNDGNINENNKSKTSINDNIIVEDLENIDFSFSVDSNNDETNSGHKSSTTDIKEIEKNCENKNNELSNNSLNSLETNLTGNNITFIDDSYKKTTGESNKSINRNRSSSSESLVEKSLNDKSNNNENSTLKMDISNDNENIEKLDKIEILLNNNQKTSFTLPNSKINNINELLDILNYFSILLENNTFFVNSELNKNAQNFIFLKQLKPIFTFISYNNIQVSVDSKRCLNLSLSSYKPLSLVPLKNNKLLQNSTIKFSITDSEKLTRILLFLWNFNNYKVDPSYLKKNNIPSIHYHKSVSTLQNLHHIKHIQWHIQNIIDNIHALSCSDYLSYLWHLQQLQNNPNCSTCQMQYYNTLNNNKCMICQPLISEQIKSCDQCLALRSNLEDDKFMDINVLDADVQNEVKSEIGVEEQIIPQKKEVYKLDTLPPEILLNIFDQFAKNSDKQNFRFTCTRFRKTLDSPNVLMIKNYEQLNYIKNLINIKKAVLNIDILFRDIDKLEITNTTFNQIRNLVILCDIQNILLSTNEYSKKLVNTAFNSFTTLTTLTIRQVSRRDIFTRLFSPRQLVLPSLKHLQFEECILSPRTLKPWEKISMPSLKSVVIDEKSVLSHIPSFLRNLSSIELKCHFRTDLWMSGEYNNLESLVVELDYKDDFNELFIKENTQMPQLKSLLLMNNKKVESLPISPKLSDLTIVCDEFTKEELNSLPECYPELSVLNIECPLDFSFPSTFKSLKSLRLEFIPTVLIRTIPAMPELTSLHIERGEHVVLNGVFPALKYLIIESCDKINFTGKFESVEWIKFRNCNNLRTIDWGFPSLNSLSLEGCFFLTSIADKYPLLQTLNIKCCKNFYKIPNNLTKLNTLNILQCDNFISVSSNFKSLTMLNVSHCRIFSYVPKELENLEWLLLEDCNNIHQIPHLEKLRHFKCLRCKNIPFPFSPCKFFPNIRSFAVTTLNKN